MSFDHPRLGVMDLWRGYDWRVDRPLPPEHVHRGQSILNCPICDPAGYEVIQRRAALELGRRLVEDSALAMTIVKNEANDAPGTWTVEDGAARFLEVMLSKGWAMTTAGQDGSAVRACIASWRSATTPALPSLTWAAASAATGIHSERQRREARRRRLRRLLGLGLPRDPRPRSWLRRRLRLALPCPGPGSVSDLLGGLRLAASARRSSAIFPVIWISPLLLGILSHIVVGQQECCCESREDQRHPRRGRLHRHPA